MLRADRPPWGCAPTRADPQQEPRSGFPPRCGTTPAWTNRSDRRHSCKAPVQMVKQKLIVQNAHALVPPGQYSFRVIRGGFGDRSGNPVDFAEVITVDAVDLIDGENHSAAFA